MRAGSIGNGKGAAPRGAAPSFEHSSAETRARKKSLAQLDGAAGFLDLLLDLLGLRLGDTFLDGLGRTLDQRLSFAHATLRDRTLFFDHVDLLAAVAGEDDVELGLLLGNRFGGGAAGCCN